MPTFSLAQKHADLNAEQAKNLLRILRENPDADLRQARGSTAGGDPSRLRGLPAIGRGCSGAVRGSDPLRALLAKERRERQR